MPTPTPSLAALITSSPEVIGSTLSIDTTVLPFTITADSLSDIWVPGAQHFIGDQIVDAKGNVQTATTNGTSNVINSFTLTSVANASGGTTVYTGTITGGANDAFVGQVFYIQGFANPLNNTDTGFLCVGSNATTLTLANTAGVAEVAGAVAKTGTIPAWSATQGGLTIDGGVTWIYLAVPDTTRIEVLVYNQVFTFLNGVHGFSGTLPNPTEAFTTFTGSVAIDPTVASTLLQIRGRNYDPATGAIWQADHDYAVGDQIIDSNGKVQTVMVAGRSTTPTHPVWRSEERV